MRFILSALIAVLLCTGAFAKGGFSGGGGRGGFSSSGARPSSPSFSSPARTPSFSSPTAPRVTTSTTTTVSRTGGGGGYYGGGSMYGGMGMGYGYSNGLLTGMILGNMMHPANTVVYSGPGGYANNALLYPNGQVVSQSGQLLGTYQDGAFNAITNGPIVAQPAPQDRQVQPVVIKDSSADVLVGVVLVVMVVVLFLFILAI